MFEINTVGKFFTFTICIASKSNYLLIFLNKICPNSSGTILPFLCHKTDFRKRQRLQIDACDMIV